jgi:four helix bundle protein
MAITSADGERRSAIASYRDLEAWKEAMDLAVHCYRMTQRFPRDERYGLVEQMRRAAVGIPSSIAEGHNRRSTRAFIHHLSIGVGSQGELDTQTELARRLAFVDVRDAELMQTRLTRVGQLMSGLSRALRQRL